MGSGDMGSGNFDNCTTAGEPPIIGSEEALYVFGSIVIGSIFVVGARFAWRGIRLSRSSVQPVKEASGATEEEFDAAEEDDDEDEDEAMTSDAPAAWPLQGDP